MLAQEVYRITISTLMNVYCSFQLPEEESLLCQMRECWCFTCRRIAAEANRINRVVSPSSIPRDIARYVLLDISWMQLC